MKTREELNAIQKEFEALNRKLAELTDQEMEQVTGGGLADELYDALSKYDKGKPGRELYGIVPPGGSDLPEEG